MQRSDLRFDTDEQGMTKTGASATIMLRCPDIPRLFGRTVYVNPGGPDFSALAIEGLIPGDVWVAAISNRTHPTTGAAIPIVVDKTAPGVYVIGADYLALRAVGTGGTDPVTADPEHDPPIEAVTGSSLEFGLIL